MISQYYANGKLLISGEYMVLHGAHALVVPLKFGQHLQVRTGQNSKHSLVSWQAYDMNGASWFNAQIDIEMQRILSCSDKNIANRVLQLLLAAGTMNHTLFKNLSYEMITRTDFNMDWGFGSSAALIANIAQWADVNPFKLLFKTLGGSGADVAASISSGPVIYSLVGVNPCVCKVTFNPDFKRHIWMVYLGHKQNSAHSVNEFNAMANITTELIDTIDEITLEMTEAMDIEYFMKLMHKHEEVISVILHKPPVKNQLFADFPGEIKSLGAWGGDFIMAVTREETALVTSYFAKKGFGMLFNYNDLILS